MLLLSWPVPFFPTRWDLRRPGTAPGLVAPHVYQPKEAISGSGAVNPTGWILLCFSSSAYLQCRDRRVAPSIQAP